MDDYVQPSIFVPAPSLSQCLRCRRPLSNSGGIASLETLKVLSAKDDCQETAQEGSSVSAFLTLCETCKSEFLGMEKNLLFPLAKEGGGSNGSSQVFDSLSVEVKNYMKGMEDQIHLLCNENIEIKRAITHLYSLVQASHSEVRNCSSHINGKVASLAETVDKVFAGSVNLDYKIVVVHRSVMDVEAKIDNMRAEIRQSTLDLQEGKGGTARSNEESQVDTLHKQNESHHQR